MDEPNEQPSKPVDEEPQQPRNLKREGITLCATGSATLLWASLADPAISMEGKVVIVGLAACSGILIFIGMKRRGAKEKSGTS